MANLFYKAKKIRTVKGSAKFADTDAMAACPGRALAHALTTAKEKVL